MPENVDKYRNDLHNRLIKLGDMIGDGDHEPWVEKEYRSTLHRLYPEIKQERRAAKAAHTDKMMAELLTRKNCPCGGQLVQTRKGTVSCKCVLCNKKYKAKTVKRKSE